MKTIIEKIELEDALADQLIDSLADYHGYNKVFPVSLLDEEDLTPKKTKQEFLQELVVNMLFVGVKQYAIDKAIIISAKEKSDEIDADFKDKLYK